MRNKKQILIFIIFIAIIAIVAFYLNNKNNKKVIINEEPDINVSLDTEVTTKKITDKNNKYIEIEATYPYTGIGSIIVAKRVEDIISTFKQENDVSKMTQEEIEFLGLSEDRVYILNIMHSYTKNDKLITHRLDVYTDTGGAHGSNTVETYTFDALGKEVTLSDLFNNETTALNTISRKAKIKIQANPDYADSITGEWLDTGASPNKDNFSAFKIDGNNFTIVFQQYQIAPYVYGNIEVSIPLSEIATLIKPIYK